jgi:hypothetical protein
LEAAFAEVGDVQQNQVNNKKQQPKETIVTNIDPYPGSKKGAGGKASGRN